MNRVVRWLADFVALFAVYVMADRAFGGWWGPVATAGAVVYSGFVFMDGILSAPK